MKLPEFKDEKIRQLAFTHRSYLNENKDATQSNERLEFLGDSILSYIVSSSIYNEFGDLPEGELTSLRSVLTNTQTLYEVSSSLGLGNELLMSKGEEESGGRSNKTILANTYEAVIGGLYLDQGIDAAKEFVTKTILERTDEFIDSQGLKDPKSKLQEFIQEKFKTSPEYNVLEESGPDHNKIYTSGVSYNGELIAKGTGHSKQEAEKDAAQKALEQLTSST